MPTEPAVSRLPGDSRLVILTGYSGSGKGTALKALEDIGYYPVDNLPVDLIQPFADMCRNSTEIGQSVLVVDIRERESLARFPTIYKKISQQTQTTLLFLEASDNVLQRRFSETRRPHPVGSGSVLESIAEERTLLQPIQQLADTILDTSRYNVHELRRKVYGLFGSSIETPRLLLTVGSFGFKYGVPIDSDLILDVRFLPNPNYEPSYRNKTGKDPEVAAFIQKYPQTEQFQKKVLDLLGFLLPHYAEEGKSYLSVYFGCTGGRHRSVYLADSIAAKLSGSDYKLSVQHRDIEKEY